MNDNNTPQTGPNRIQAKLIDIRLKAAPFFKRLLPDWVFEIVKRFYNWLTGSYGVAMIIDADAVDTIPEPDLPAEYTFHTLNTGKPEDYVLVMQESLVKQAAAAWFETTFTRDKEYDPSNLFLIYRSDEPVAAAAAWHEVYEGEKTGLLHMVGVREKYQGIGLGRAVVVKTLKRLRQRGFRRIKLATESYRQPAIRLYLSLGFQPVIKNRRSRKLWKEILLS
jgi:mycothiol synthase